MALIYRKTGNLRAVQLLLGHPKVDSTVRYLGVELEDRSPFLTIMRGPTCGFPLDFVGNRSVTYVTELLSLPPGQLGFGQYGARTPRN